MPNLSADQVREWIAYARLEITQFAKAIGVSRTAVSNWVNGNGSPSSSNVQAIATFFGVASEDLSLGPSRVFGYGWPQERITYTPRKLIYNGLGTDVTSDRDVVVGRFFIQFMKALEWFMGTLPLRPCPGLVEVSAANYGDTLTLRQLVDLVWQLNISPRRLPLPNEALQALARPIEEIRWTPNGELNAITYLMTTHNSLAESESVFYMRRRLKFARQSVKYIGGLTCSKRRELADDLRGIQLDLESATSKRRLISSQRHHELFHRLVIESRHVEKGSSYLTCLKKTLYLPTQRAIDDSAYAAISWQQHYGLIEILEVRDFRSRNLEDWYEREHAVGMAAALTHLEEVCRIKVNA